jgi:hypothetical protein
MFYLGIDWSEDHHNLCIRNEAGAVISRIEFENSLTGFEQIQVEQRKLGVPVLECLVAIETAHHRTGVCRLHHPTAGNQRVSESPAGERSTRRR